MITAYVKLDTQDIPRGIKAKDLSYLQIQELLNNSVLSTKLNDSFKGRETKEISDKIILERQTVEVIHVQIQVIVGIPDG